MAKKKEINGYERFMALSDEEKEAEWQEIDRLSRQFPHPMAEGGPKPGRPLTVAQRRLLEKAKRKAKRGRPTIGDGAKIVPISIERGLLRQADSFAKRHHLKRSQMVAQGLRLIMETA